MKGVWGVVAAAGLVACTGPVEPVPVYPSYFLSQLDGKSLPTPWGGDGSVLLAGSLSFGDGGRPRTPGPAAGTVRYSTTLRLPDQTEQQSSVDLDYAIEDNVLRINLCPPLALCLASTELVGPITGPNDPLVLTHYLGGNPGSVYRFFPALPD